MKTSTDVERQGTGKPVALGTRSEGNQPTGIGKLAWPTGASAGRCPDAAERATVPGTRVGRMLTGWRRNPPRPVALPGFGVSLHINATVGSVGERVIRQVFRTSIGDWAAVLELDGKLQTEIFDHHPTVATMRALRPGGVDIADDVIAQGAEGQDIRWQARPADDE